MPDHLLTDRVIVITGAGSGLGAAYARDCARHGATVVVADTDTTAAGAVAGELTALGWSAVSRPVDVSDPVQAEQLIAGCVSEFGRIDGLVNNAGVEATGLAWEVSSVAARRMVEVNLLGTIYCGTSAMRRMVPRGHGTIVNITSGAHQGLRRMAAYGATKGAIASLTHCWGLDLLGTGVRCNAVSPLAATHMSRSNLEADGYRGRELDDRYAQFPTAAENAPLVTLLLSDETPDFHGQILRYDAGGITLVSHPALVGTTVPVRPVGTVEGMRMAVGALRGQLLKLGPKRLSDDSRFTVGQRDL